MLHHVEQIVSTVLYTAKENWFKQRRVDTKGIRHIRGQTTGSCRTSHLLRFDRQWRLEITLPNAQVHHFSFSFFVLFCFVLQDERETYEKGGKLTNFAIMSTDGSLETTGNKIK